MQWLFRSDDPALGEDVAAMVVPADKTVTEADLRHYLLERLVPFKVPRRIFFVDEIPKTPTGKLMRDEGTQRYSLDSIRNKKNFRTDPE